MIFFFKIFPPFIFFLVLGNIQRKRPVAFICSVGACRQRGFQQRWVKELKQSLIFVYLTIEGGNTALVE